MQLLETCGHTLQDFGVWIAAAAKLALSAPVAGSTDQSSQCCPNRPIQLQCVKHNACSASQLAFQRCKGVLTMYTAQRTSQHVVQPNPTPCCCGHRQWPGAMIECRKAEMNISLSLNVAVFHPARLMRLLLICSGVV